jgi:transcriptional regulator with XRE-family HTH domain
MKLDRYLALRRMTQKEFAAHADINQSTVARLLHGDRRPSLAMIERIHAATNGRVTARDWLNPEKGPDASA